MATSLTINGFSIGTDLSATLSDEYGDVFPAGDLGHLRSIDLNFDMETLKIQPITRGGRPLYLSIPSGLTGNMRFTRFNGSITSIFTNLYNAFYTAGLLPKWTLSMKVANRDGTTDSYLVTGMVLARPSFGTFEDIREVDQALEFMGETVLSTSNLASIVPALTAAVLGNI